MLYDFISQDIFGQFTDPKKRLFFGYIFSAFVLATLWLIFIKKRSIRQSISELFSPKIWLSKSSKIDVICFVANRLIFLLIQPALITQIAIATALYQLLHSQSFLQVGAFGTTPYWFAATSFTLFFFLLDDFARFITHLALHKIPALWEFHRFHHSAEHLTPLTVTRTHPIEGVIFTLRSALVQGIAIGLFVFLFGNQVGLLTIFGVNVFVVIFHGLGSNLRHSHIAIRYPKIVELFLMSPAQHQLHHSNDPKHHDKNFGVALSVWDRLCGTFHFSTNGKLTFGLGIETGSLTSSLLTLYLNPFLQLKKNLLRKHGRINND